MEEILGNEFTWWMGVVEDRDDPLKLGRCRVRCYHWHTDDTALLPTDKLPWAQPMCPLTNGATQDIGETPLGIQVGTWVVGFFMDGKLAQKPMIMGTIAGIPGEQPDMNRLARNDPEFPHPIVDPTGTEWKDQADIVGGKRTTLVTTAGPTALLGIGTEVWNEPDGLYNAQYPHNKVMETERGHIKEFDDTPGEERIHERHRTGTFYEIDSEGRKVTRVVNDNYDITLGNDYAYVSGNINITAGGDVNIKSSGPGQNINLTSTTGDINLTAAVGPDSDVNVQALDDVNVTALTGDVNVTSTVQDVVVQAGRSINLIAGLNIALTAPRIDLN